MAYITVNTSASLSLAAAIFHLISAIQDRMTGLFSTTRPSAELAGFSDRMLDDLGLTRNDLRGTVRSEMGNTFV